MNRHDQLNERALRLLESNSNAKYVVARRCMQNWSAGRAVVAFRLTTPWLQLGSKLSGSSSKPFGRLLEKASIATFAGATCHAWKTLVAFCRISLLRRMPLHKRMVC